MNKLTLALLLGMLIVSACGQSGNKEKTADESRNANPVTTRFKPEKKGEIVAKVNGVPIYKDELKRDSVDSLVTDEILYQEGLKKGLEKKYQDKVMAYQMSLVVMDMKRSILDNAPPEKAPTDQELLNYYNRNKNNFTNIRIEEINFPNKELGEKILKMADQGKNFQEIAKSLSDSGSQVTATDIGFNRSFARFFKVKKVGTLSGIVDKKDGTYSILKITDVKIVPFESVKGVLRYTLEALKKAAIYDDYARKIAKEDGMKIEIMRGSGQQ